MKLLAYNKMSAILWFAVKELQEENEIRKLKKYANEDDGKPKPKAKAKSK